MFCPWSLVMYGVRASLPVLFLRHLLEGVSASCLPHGDFAIQASLSFAVEERGAILSPC